MSIQQKYGSRVAGILQNNSKASLDQIVQQALSAEMSASEIQNKLAEFHQFSKKQINGRDSTQNLQQHQELKYPAPQQVLNAIQWCCQFAENPSKSQNDGQIKQKMNSSSQNKAAGKESQSLSTQKSITHQQRPSELQSLEKTAQKVKAQTETGKDALLQQNPFNQNSDQQEDCNSQQEQKQGSKKQHEELTSSRKDDGINISRMVENEQKIDPEFRDLSETELLNKKCELDKKIDRYLEVSYWEYSKNTYRELEAFDINNQNKSTIDLRIFLKFYKAFGLSDICKVNEVILIFKRIAFNAIKLDLSKFKEMNSVIIDRSLTENDCSNSVLRLRAQCQNRKVFIKHFTKEKMKTYLQVSSKAALEKKIEELHEKQRFQASLAQEKDVDKGQAVNEFLKRNFDYEVQRWYQKKQINPEELRHKPVKLSLAKRRQKPNVRNEENISSSIKNLESRSEKKLHDLKSLINDDFDSEQKRFMSKVRQKSHELLPPTLSKERRPLHQSKRKNIASVYNELEGISPRDIKATKLAIQSQIRLQDKQSDLDEVLKRNEQIKLENLPQKSSSVKNLPRLAKNKREISLQRLNKIQSHAAPGSRRNLVLDNLEDYHLNEFLVVNEKQSKKRSKNHSSPLPNSEDSINDRQRALRNNKQDFKSKKNLSNNVVAQIIEQKMLGRKQDNKGLHRNLDAPQAMAPSHAKKSIIRKQYQEKLEKSLEMPKELKQEPLFKYKDEVYELFKYFRAREEAEQAIVKRGIHERKGYLLEKGGSKRRKVKSGVKDYKKIGQRQREKILKAY